MAYLSLNDPFVRLALRDLNLPAYAKGTNKQATGNELVCRTHTINDTKTIQIELPGVKKENLKLTSSKQAINVSAKRTIINSLGETTETVEDSFWVDPSFDLKTIKASLEDGLLTISMVKRELNDTQNIEIK